MRTDVQFSALSTGLSAQYYRNVERDAGTKQRETLGLPVDADMTILRHGNSRQQQLYRGKTRLVFTLIFLSFVSLPVSFLSRRQFL